MAELVQKIEDLSAQPDDLHCFCPRAKSDDFGVYFDEDLAADTLQRESEEEKEEREEKVKEAQDREDNVLDACKILAFSGPDAEPFQDKLKKILIQQLERCDICVREYYRGRVKLLANLQTVHDEDDVKAFMQKFDTMNNSRICQGLDSMAASLLDLPPEQRTITAISVQEQYALLEALNSESFLRDEDLLVQHFDKPFRLVQSRKKIKMPSFTPGMTAFLFSGNTDRSAWAVRNFGTIKRNVSESEFEHAIKPFFAESMGRVNIVSLEKDLLPAFWRGARLIVLKLDKDLITHGLRSMSAQLPQLALEHFQVDSSHIPDMLTTLQLLLEKSPGDFWDSISHIPAQTVIETIFSSPSLEKLFMIKEEKEALLLEEKLAWTEPLIRSIRATNLVPPIRAMLKQLLVRFQGDQYSRYAQRVTWEYGLRCAVAALHIMRLGIRSGPVLQSMLDVIRDHIGPILEELENVKHMSASKIVADLSSEVVRLALELDIHSLANDRATIIRDKTLDREIGVSNLQIWKTSTKAVKSDYPELPAAIVHGMRGLLSIDKCTSRQMQAAPKAAEGWNNAYTRVTSYVLDLLERLQDFDPDSLMVLFESQDTANGFFALLVNGNSDINAAALGVLKTLSLEDTRRDAVGHVVKSCFGTTLSAAKTTLNNVAKAKIFTPCPILLKITSDIFDCLCDSSDGFLRSGKTLDSEDLMALEAFWQSTWQCLDTIFAQTEPWSMIGYDKELLQTFCRDTMDFAEMAFDNYSIVASSLKRLDGKGDADVDKALLQLATKVFGNITKWLRLRDDYLIIKAVSLTGKMLSRLRDSEIEISNDSAMFLEDVAGGKVRTKLTNNQKAEVQRALERHLGQELTDVIDLEAPSKPFKQSSLQSWATTGRDSPLPASSKKRETINLDAWSSAAQKRKDLDPELKKLHATVSPTADAFAARRAAMKQQQTKSFGAATVKAAQKQQADVSEFRLKRQKELEEKKNRDAAAIAKAKGQTVGGSALGELGVLGKDHTMKGQNVMVSSDEESEDDEDDLDMGLFGEKSVAKKMRAPDVNPHGAIGLKAEQKNAPTRINRAARSTKDMRARLAPDLTPLHRVILKWDFFHDGDYPPGHDEYEFQKVSNSFSDPVTYQGTFQPLLILEAWQGLVKSREESSSKPYEVKIVNRSSVDTFLEISSSVSQAENKELQLMEGDIVLLSKARKPTDDGSVPHCLARIYRVKRQKQFLEIVYQVMAGTSLTSSLTMGASVHGIKIQSITTLEREYGALLGLQYYDLCMQIVKARPSARINFSEKKIQNYMENWNLNKAQSAATNAALENEGFSLIQGPPGSGKTKTIVAIVGGLLSSTLGASSGSTRINVPNLGAGNAGNDQASKKLLVCAPSNAAVDELVMRLKEGIKTKSGRHHHLNIVRIGRSDAINTNVVDVTMDELVSKRLGSSAHDPKAQERKQQIFAEHKEVSEKLREAFDQKEKGEVKGKELAELDNFITQMKRKKALLSNQIDNAKDQEKNAGREAELNRKRAQQAVLDDAHVICATLSGSGHDMFQSLNIEFETVIIDEAAQCVEMANLIPLKYGCVKCIMVGDPKQLPPTVFSKEAARFQYEQSLFVRMQNNFANEVHLLDTQYRMHPAISVFPSQTFYDGLLKDGPGMEDLRQKPWHSSSLLAPYRFYDVQGQHHSAPKGHSLINLAEIDVAIALFSRLTNDFKAYDFKGKIGIITPYKSQLRALKDRFSTRFGNTILEAVEFNTTDAFQGRESEVIIFSCVRASPAGGIGFLQDIRRMNVGLTRAKSSLWVLGNSQSLVRGEFWRKLVEDSRARDMYTTGDLMSMLQRPSSAFPAQVGKQTKPPSAKMHQDRKVSVPDVKAPTSFTKGSRQAPQPTAGNRAVQSADTTSSGRSTPDEDRMEGVKYRFQDRVPKKADNERPRSATKYDNDVEMEDASSASGTSTPSGTLAPPKQEQSRSVTPFSGEEGRRTATDAKGKTKPVGAPLPAGVRKRAAPSPFLQPKKKPKT